MVDCIMANSIGIIHEHTAQMKIFGSWQLLALVVIVVPSISTITTTSTATLVLSVGSIAAQWNPRSSNLAISKSRLIRTPAVDISINLEIPWLHCTSIISLYW